MYATTYELKSKTFTLCNENITPEIGIELTFTLEFKIQNEHFSEEYHRFFSSSKAHIQHMFGWESTYVCQNLRNKMQGI